MSTGNPTLDKALAIAAALIPLCSALSHIIPPTTIVGKIVSWLALNGGKFLSKEQP